jgi:hypothetical protein
MRSKRDLWQMIAFAGIFSRLTPTQAAAGADAILEEYEKRAAKWDEEERLEDERRGRV